MDNLPLGRYQWSLTVDELARSHGLNEQSLSRELQSALVGVELVKHDYPSHTLEVRLGLSDEDKNRMDRISWMPISVKGFMEPLGDLVNIKKNKGYDSIMHYFGLRAVIISANVDQSKNNINTIIHDVMPKLKKDIEPKYGVKVSEDLQSRYEKETIPEMILGVIIGLLLIYFCLSVGYSIIHPSTDCYVGYSFWSSWCHLGAFIDGY